MNEVRQGQSFLDMALQMTGSIDNAVALAVLNGRSLTDDLSIAQVLNPVSPTDQRVVDWFTPVQKRPATDWRNILTEEFPELEGIDYWALEYDFEVQ